MAGERVSAVGMICKTHIGSVRAGETGEEACLRVVAEFKERFGRLPGAVEYNAEKFEVIHTCLLCNRPMFAAPGYRDTVLGTCQRCLPIEPPGGTR